MRNYRCFEQNVLEKGGLPQCNRKNPKITSSRQSTRYLGPISTSTATIGKEDGRAELIHLRRDTFVDQL